MLEHSCRLLDSVLPPLGFGSCAVAWDGEVLGGVDDGVGVLEWVDAVSVDDAVEVAIEPALWAVVVDAAVGLFFEGESEAAPGIPSRSGRWNGSKSGGEVFGGIPGACDVGHAVDAQLGEGVVDKLEVSGCGLVAGVVGAAGGEDVSGAA
jgi:hypothetical protein